MNLFKPFKNVEIDTRNLQVEDLSPFQSSIYRSCFVKHYDFFDASENRNFVSSLEESRLTDKYYYGLYNEVQDLILRLIYLYGPEATDEQTISSGMLSYRANTKDISSGRRTDISIGRFIKKIAPDIEDHKVEEIVNSLKRDYGVTEYDVQVSDQVYPTIIRRLSNESSYFDTSKQHKHLSNSCMNYDFDELEIHPMAAYNSGDFEAVYILDTDSRLVARTIARKSNKTYSPIYSVSSVGIRVLTEWLRKNGYTPLWENFKGWVGAKLVLNRCVWTDPDDEDNYFDVYSTPYLDIIPRQYCEITRSSRTITIADSDLDLESVFDFDEDYYPNCVSLKNSEGYNEI